MNHEQRLRDLCSELNEAEQLIGRAISEARAAGYLVSLGGSFSNRSVWIEKDDETTGDTDAND